MVLLDSSVIARAPPRLLVAGLGDALATYFEVRERGAAGGAEGEAGLRWAAALGQRASHAL